MVRMYSRANTVGSQKALRVDRCLVNSIMEYFSFLETFGLCFDLRKKPFVEFLKQVNWHATFLMRHMIK